MNRTLLNRGKLVRRTSFAPDEIRLFESFTLYNYKIGSYYNIHWGGWISMLIGSIFLAGICFYLHLFIGCGLTVVFIAMLLNEIIDSFEVFAGKCL